MEEILRRVQEGKLSVEEAKKKLATYEDLGFAKVDHHRKKRQGFPEIIYGEGKTVEQLISILEAIQAKNNNVIITRINKEKANEVLERHPEFSYHDVARILYWKTEEKKKNTNGYIAVICAGTSDLPVAEEAAVTAELLGSNVRRFYDVGVAGMEGALTSVVGGLVSHPVISVPTSVGYGASFGGVSALLTMLNSCASGVSVVNIDNGFGGAYSAVLIDQIAKDK